MTFLNHLTLVGFILNITVIGCRAQVRLDVTFDPPSPVSQGNVTFRCNFTLPSDTILAQQYWQIVNGDRFFEYVPGSEPTIHEDYEDKILDFSTDNETYVNIVFDVTACDVEQYLCNILANSSADNSRQESLEVENMIPPVLMNGGNEVSENETEYLPFGGTISCVLQNAGPPLPEYLELETNYTSFSPRNASSPAQNDTTCTWSYLNSVELVVNASNLTEPVWFQCRANYTENPSQYSPVLIITPEMSFTTDATASTEESFTDSNSTGTTTMETTPNFTDTSETMTSFPDTSISETTFSLNSSTITDEETTTMTLSTEAETTGTETEVVTTATTTTMSDSTITTEMLTTTSSQNILKPFSKYSLILMCTLIFGLNL